MNDNLIDEQQNFYMLLEIPEGDINKYEYDKKQNKLVLDRINPFSAPFSYGMLWANDEKQKTLCEDGDDLDVVCLGSTALAGSLIPIIPIGILKIIDTGEEDNKIIAINKADLKLKKIKTLSDLDQNILEKISFFFSSYKDWKQILNSKIERKIILKGWGEKEEAYEEIKKCQIRYQNKTKT